MSLVPGAAGEKTVFPDGIQVDHISENTVGHGSRPKPITDPTTYPVATGEIGETVRAVGSQSTNSAGTAYDVVNSGVLGAGIWLISGWVRCLGSGSLSSSQSWVGTSPATYASRIEDSIEAPTSTLASASFTMVQPVIYKASSSSFTVYLTAQNAGASNIATNGYLRCVRIA